MFELKKVEADVVFTGVNAAEGRVPKRAHSGPTGSPTKQGVLAC